MRPVLGRHACRDCSDYARWRISLRSRLCCLALRRRVIVQQLLLASTTLAGAALGVRGARADLLQRHNFDHVLGRLGPLHRMVLVRLTLGLFATPSSLCRRRWTRSKLTARRAPAA